MRRQSPSSSGLLPATYSRRRRGRPNETLVGIAGENYSGANITQQQPSSTYNSYYSTNNDTYEDVGSVSSGNNDNNNFGLRTRGSPTRQTYTEIDAQQQRYNDYDSEDENDENNYNRNNNHNNDVYEQGYEDVLDKPLKLSDFLINDRCYHRYLLEGKRSSYRGIINGVKPSTDDGNKGFMDPIFLAKVSTICSFIGMLFLLFVAIIIETQPLYIKGVKVYSSNQNEDIEYRFRKETSNALKASAAYFLTMVLSIIYIHAPKSLELNPAIGRICHLKRLVVSTYFRYRRRHYDAIPDNNGSIFGGGSSSTSGSILPTHHSSSANGSEGDKLLKSRRRKKRSSKRKNPDDKHDDDDHGGKGGGVLGKIKSWGIMGGGSSQTVRKKDR